MRQRAYRRGAAVIAMLAALMLTAAACSSDDDGGSTGGTDATGGTGAAGSMVDVTVQEFAVLPAPDSVPAGDVSLTNDGPEDTHEFVVFKTDLAPDALPTASDGSVDEEGEGVELVDEIEDIAVDSPELTVSLEAGSYVLICNIVEDEGDETIVHYQQGMRTAFNRRVGGRLRARDGAARAGPNDGPSHSPRTPRGAGRPSCPPPRTPRGARGARPCVPRPPADRPSRA